jgi:hypothetical protein
MKPRFVADGGLRLRESPEFQVRLRELRESVRARHAVGLAKAGFFRRLILRWRIAAEVRKERRKIEPSPQSLYSSHRAASGSRRG